MRNNKKIILFSGMLLGMAALQSCNTIRDLTGGQRTLPDDDKVDFGNRHAPELNPGGDGGNGMDTGSSVSGRRVPVENAASMQANNGGVALADTPGVSSAPVMAVTSAPVSALSPVSAAPQAPAAAATANDARPGQGVYPALSSVPIAVPAHATAAQNTAAMTAMTNEQASSESSRRALMSDSSATVMTSPQTGRLLDNAADIPLPPAAPAVPKSVPVAASTAAPVTTAALPAAMTASGPAPANSANNDAGFRAWLHRNVGFDTATANAPPRSGPAENPPAPLPSASPVSGSQQVAVPAKDAMASAAPANVSALEPVHLHPPGPAATAAATPAVLPALEPVHLHPPTSVASTSQLPAVSGSAAGSPAYASSGSVRYLSESRYAERRDHVPADDDASD